jgi:hypothetical protein
MKSNKIKNIIHLGDVFDNRKRIDINTLFKAKIDFFDVLLCEEIEMLIVLGNHDIYLRDTLHINSPRVLLREYNNISIITDPEQIGNLGFVPWLTKTNAIDVKKFLDRTGAEYLFGHFELNGYRMSKSQVCNHGMPPQILSKFKGVYSGHFHSKNSKGNIHYLGTQTQHTWEDAGEDKGFHVFDDEDGSLTFIKNPYSVYESIKYVDGLEAPDLKNKVVRVYVNEVESQSKFDKFIRNIEESGVHQLRIIDLKPKMSVNEVDEEETSGIVEIEDTATIIKKFVEKPDVRSVLLNMYQEALNVR